MMSSGWQAPTISESVCSKTFDGMFVRDDAQSAQHEVVQSQIYQW